MAVSAPKLDRKTNLLVTEEISPQAIALLVVVSLYSGGKIPDEILQPVVISLIKLLNHQPLCDTKGELISIPSSWDLCHEFRTAAEKFTGKSADKSVRSLIFDLLTELWKINSVEQLDKTAWNTIHLVADPRVVSVDSESANKFSPRSTIGNFIQKCVTTLKILNYDESYLLLEALISYREPSRELFKSMGGQIDASAQPTSSTVGKNQDEDNDLFRALQSKLTEYVDINVPLTTDTSTTDDSRLLPVPKYDLEVLLEKQIELLESNGQRTPKFLRRIMEFMTSNDMNTYSIQSANLNSYPSYYYLKYLECLHESDYQGSFQALHQYFDHVVSSNSKYFYHFALISLASLHQHFGENEKALDAIEEAISVARENKDNTTLAYILSWFFGFMRNKPELWKSQKFYHNNNESHLLDFLVKKSKSVSLSLYAMSYHYEILHIMNTGGSLNKYLESLFKATYISINDTPVSFIKTMEMQSAVWLRVGNPHLSDIYSQIAGDYAKKLTKIGDEVALEIRRAYLLHHRGDTESGLKLLAAVEPRIRSDVSLSITLRVRTLVLQVMTDLKKKRFKYAQKLVDTLLDEDVKDVETYTELKLLSAEVQFGLGNNSKSLKLISDTLAYLDSLPSQTKTNIYTIMRLNLIRCRLFVQSSAPQRTISLLVHQIQLAKKIGLVSIVVEGMIIFSSLLNKLRSYQDAYNLLSKKMTTIISVDNGELTALAYYELSASCYHLSQKADESTRKSLFHQFLRYLNVAISGFKKSGNLAMVESSFALEKQMAEQENQASLLEHSQQGLAKIYNRTTEESNTGYIKPKHEY